MNNKLEVTAVIVTFNRKQALSNILMAVAKQTYPISNVLVVDNASTDGTASYISDKLALDIDVNINEKVLTVGNLNQVKINWYRAASNGGGSNGFYLGMKIANEYFNPDLYWLMDDDGEPDKSCLSKLVQSRNDTDYVMPMSIDIDNRDQLSWPVRMHNGKKTINYQELKDDWGPKMDFVTPFNGALLSRKCVNKVGYINPKLFIWGDEYDHYWRCRQAGITPITITEAKFYHPAQKLPLVKIMFGLSTAPYVDSKLRMVCLARNYTYIYKKYGQAYKIPLKFIQYTWLFWFTRKGDFAGWWLYCQSVADGLKGDFTRHLKYLGK